jgi:hypothetical protein
MSTHFGNILHRVYNFGMGRNKVEPKKAKNSGNNSESHSVALIPNPAGNGALLAGGKPGNKGGTGRPPNVLRQMARDLYGEYLEPATRKIMESENPMDNRTKVAVLDHYAKFGLGEAKVLLQDEFMEAVVEVAYELLSVEQGGEFIKRLEARLKDAG